MAPRDLKQTYMCLILPCIYCMRSSYKNDEFIAFDLWYFNTEMVIFFTSIQNIAYL
jgi:hypothetical protein